MEHVGAISEGEWNNNYGGMYSTTEEPDFMAQLLGNCSLPSELPNASNIAWPLESNVKMAALMDENSMHSSDGNAAANNVYCFSQSCSYSGGNDNGVFLPSSSSHDQGYYYANSDSHHLYLANNGKMPVDYCMTEAKNTDCLIEGDEFLNQDASNDSMECNEKLTESSMEEKMSSPLKKRSRMLTDVPRNKRSLRPKKNQGNDEEEEMKKGVFQKQNSMSCCSEDEHSNASQEINKGVASTSSSKGVGAPSSRGKTRASRGSATDPQSLYARKRREKINERLRILQNLVPNGTKVDISTMLEEAVQYVKFLQLQIKLLSSDELWMYAPIAYNGMDIGLDHLKIATPKS